MAETNRQNQRNFTISTGTPSQTTGSSTASSLTPATARDLYQQGRYAIRRGDREAAARAFQAAARGGSAQAAHLLGLLRRDDGRLDDADPDGAIVWLRRAAERGVAESASAIGLIRDRQGRVSDDDRDGAIAWYKMAAAAGSAIAMNNLGVLRRQAGRVDGADGAEYWYREAAERGNPKAMFNLGMLRHRQRRTRHPDGDCAVYWLKRAEEAGLAPATAALADVSGGRLRRRRIRQGRYQAL